MAEPAAGPGARFESSSAHLVRRNRKLLLGAAAPIFLAAWIALLSIVLANATFLAIALPLLLLGALSVGLSYKANLDPVADREPIAADGEGLYRGGQLVVPRSDIVAGFVAPGPPAMVRLFRGMASVPVRVAVRDVGEGRALLRALGLDTSQSVGELHAGSQLLEWSPRQQALQVAPVFGGIGLLFSSLLLPLPWLSTSLLALSVFTLVASVASIATIGLARTRVLVGVDGVATRWLTREAFYPFSEIAAVQRYQRDVGGRSLLGVELVRKDGSSVRIPCGQEGWSTIEPGEIEERIREAFDQHQQSAGGPTALAALARGARPHQSWVAALRALGAGANADMRTAPVDPGRFLRIAEDASATPRERAAAAVAAVHGLGQEARARIRIAADTTAAPLLRRTLARIVDERADDEAIAEALAQLEASEAPDQSGLSRSADEP